MRGQVGSPVPSAPSSHPAPLPPPPLPLPPPPPHLQCGDLNLVTLLHLVWILTICGGASNHAVNCMAACKLLWAYAGQMSHRMAHAPVRPWWATALQGLGLFVSPALHKAHHETYDDGFPILNGVSAPLVAWLNTAIPDRRVWLGFFAVASLTDIVLLTHLTNSALPLLGLGGAQQ